MDFPHTCQSPSTGWICLIAFIQFVWGFCSMAQDSWGSVRAFSIPHTSRHSVTQRIVKGQDPEYAQLMVMGYSSVNTV